MDMGAIIRSSYFLGVDRIITTIEHRSDCMLAVCVVYCYMFLV